MTLLQRLRDTKWIYKKKKKIENYDVDLDILNILQNRDINSKDEIDEFINSKLENISSPFLLKDMESSVEKILKAKENKESVWIYGDYDVDGITATSLCVLALSEIDMNVKYYIPLRDEGYGLNKDAMDYIKNQGGNLIITVDCGISAHSEIEYANSIGLEIIVTDHHEINNGIPDCSGVINPKREDNKLEFRYLAGVGTAFMLVFAVFQKLGIGERAYSYLDIVAIGTVADIVPLIEENRIFTKFGMEKLRSSKVLGLNMLIKKIFEDYKTRDFSTYDIGFIIAPIFNAAGRLEDAKQAVELFLEDNHVRCNEIIDNLLKNNSVRKEIQENIFENAVEIIEKEKLYENGIIIVAKENFHHGVIGIVASKILDKYYKPTIIMEIKSKEGIATASCRSIEGFNIVEAIDEFSELLEKYGGHSGAAGFSIKIENIAEFSRKINEYARKKIEMSTLIKPIKIDGELPIYKVSYDFLNRISKLEPFGFGNPSPVFSLSECQITEIKLIGKDRTHLMLGIEKNGINIKNCVWFGGGEYYEELSKTKNIDVAFKLKLETFMDRYQYKIYIEDIKVSRERKTEKEVEEKYNFPLESVIYTRKKIVDGKTSLAFYGDRIDVVHNRSFLATLDTQTTYLLENMQKKYGYNFSVKIKDIYMKNENYNIHILIDRDYNFISRSIKEGELFREIKDFLIGDFPYNSIQKKVLGKIFKEKKNITAIVQKGRGINTIIQTIALYYKNIEKKALLITREKVSDRTKNSIEIADKFIDGYDYYIIYNEKIEVDMEKMDRFLIVINDKKDCLDNINLETIEDKFDIPKNIVLYEEEDEKIDVFSNLLSLEKRVEMLKKIKTNIILPSTKDIFLYL